MSSLPLQVPGSTFIPFQSHVQLGNFLLEHEILDHMFILLFWFIMKVQGSLMVPARQGFVDFLDDVREVPLHDLHSGDFSLSKAPLEYSPQRCSSVGSGDLEVPHAGVCRRA